MKNLEAMLSQDSGKIEGSAINFGKWDIALGMNRTIWLRNPNTYVKANLRHLRHKDSRLNISLPDEILPGETAAVDIRIPPMTFSDDKEEEAFFNDVLDSISGKIIWEKP